VAGLLEPVENATDGLGILHVYAENEYERFFMQGFNDNQSSGATFINYCGCGQLGQFGLAQ